jgi:peroxiredoxin
MTRKPITIALLFALIAVSSRVYADPMDLPEDVRNAFGNAGLPLLREKRRIRDFTLQTADGRSITLSQLKGKVVFLNFWATWCPPCRSEMPSMEMLYQRYKQNGLELIALDIMEKPSQVQAFMQEYAYTFPVVLDTRGEVSNQYGIQAVPATFIIDRDNTIIFSAVGTRNWSTPGIFAAFERLLHYER